ncbi:hypothetical protein CHS0354_042557 [Potamilus streckersoni]|uniref:Uncharacterized protein n=1 Tax=Potamilus streckersoni TaxID=2493646 RepID=A0AAE0TEN7_9BIVA|nr:hypothetical protein CHS0354_042557 [Potamilus streckersoni]
MSLTSKAVFGGSVVFTVSIISYVHWKQNYDRQRMREGVYRDLDRQQQKMQNLQMLKDQIALAEKYRDVERVEKIKGEKEKGIA